MGNNSASVKRSTWAVLATTPTSAPLFVAAVAVSEHFSEFYLAAADELLRHSSDYALRGLSQSIGIA